MKYLFLLAVGAIVLSVGAGIARAEDEEGSLQVGFGYGVSAVDGDSFWGPRASCRVLLAKNTFLGLSAAGLGGDSESQLESSLSATGEYYEVYGEVGRVRQTRYERVRAFGTIRMGWASLRKRDPKNVSASTRVSFSESGILAGFGGGVGIRVFRSLQLESDFFLNAVFMNGGTQTRGISDNRSEDTIGLIGPETLFSQGVTLKISGTF